MNAKPSAGIANHTEDCLFSVNDGFDSHDSHRNSVSSKPRNSSEYHSSSIDLNAQMHGATPIPPRFRGRPPRLSLQSASSGTTASTNMDSHSPFYNNSEALKPIHINTLMSCNTNSNENILT
jgi:hypothetical protein